MKKISLLIVILSFISCNSEKITTFKSEGGIPDAELIGIYKYKTSKQAEDHYIVIDIQNGKYNGLYFGTEDSGGHGVFFYSNEMENLNIENNKISFQIGKRNLYKTTQLKIVKRKRDLEKELTSGVSKNKLKYSGEISKNGFILNCKSGYGDCWENKLNFKKLTAKR